MCYESKCSKCGKTSWGGCGRHVASVYRGIPEGQRCDCKPWPGVGDQQKGSGASGGAAAAGATEQQGSSLSSTCTIM